MALNGIWRYSLCDPLTGNTYQVENGIVVSKGNYKPLDHTPIGWQDILIGFERDMDKFGINRTFTLPLGFVIEGVAILSYLKWTKNFDQRVTLLIQRKELYIDTTHYYFWYKYFYKGELDFTTYKYDDAQQRVDISITEGGITKLLKANEGTDYEIPLDEEFIWVKMDGINLHKSVTYTVPAPTSDDPEGITVRNTSISEFAMPTATIGVDGAASGIAVFDQLFDPVPNHFTYLSTSSNYLVKLDETFHTSVSINIAGTIKVKCITELPTGAELQIRVLKQDGTAFQTGDPNPVGLLTRTPTGNFAAGTTYSYDFDITGILQPGDVIFFICQLFTVVSNAIEIKIQFAEGTEFQIKFSTQQETTYVKWKQPLPAFQYLCKKITGADGNSKSDLLAGRGDIVITSGSAIRGFDGSVIKTNLDKFFNSYNVMLNAGLGVETEKITLEEKVHFFQADNPIPLGKIKAYKDGSYTPYLYNTIKIGFPEVNIENVNGRYAFNTTYLYSSPVKSIVKELTLVSDYKADPYEEELVRINFDGKSTTDAQQDNDVYAAVIDLSSAEVLADGRTVYSLLRHPAWVITGMPSPETVYNFDITPRRLLDVHANWLAGVFDGFATGNLHFETSQYNRDVVANGVVEDGDVSIGGFGSPIFKPVQYEFESLFSGQDLQNSDSLIVAYDEGTEWTTGGTGVTFNDTSRPYHGIKNILGASGSVASQINLYAPSPMNLIIAEEVSFYLFLLGAFPPSSFLTVALYNGGTLVRTKHLNATNFNQTDTSNWQRIAVPVSGMTVGSTSETFDRITITVGGLARPAFAIDYVRLAQSAQDNLVELLEANPNRCFSFIHPNGNLFKGHNIKIGIAPNSEQEQAFLLLATGDTDLTKLILT